MRLKMHELLVTATLILCVRIDDILCSDKLFTGMNETFVERYLLLMNRPKSSMGISIVRNTEIIFMSMGPFNQLSRVVNVLLILDHKHLI